MQINHFSHPTDMLMDMKGLYRTKFKVASEMKFFWNWKSKNLKEGKYAIVIVQYNSWLAWQVKFVGPCFVGGGREVAVGDVKRVDRCVTDELKKG